MVNKSVKSIKKVLQELRPVPKSPPAENPHHAETSQSTRNDWLQHNADPKPEET